mgnify:CR=1 FL=1
MDDYAFDCTVLGMALACLCALLAMCHSLERATSDLHADDSDSSNDDEVDIMLHDEPLPQAAPCTRRHSW